MNTFVLASKNKHKAEEIKTILGADFDVITQTEAGAGDISVVEDGKTFEENAVKKAETIMRATKRPTIADDSGLCVSALDDRPGVYSARYAPKGEECTKLLDEMKDVADEKREARFECCICFIGADGEPVYVSGRCEGVIGHEERGTNGFGYDPVFVVNGRTMAELSADEKNKISHRGAALGELYNFLKERYGE